MAEMLPVTHSYEIQALQSAHFTLWFSCGFFGRLKYHDFSALNPLQAVQTLLHSAKYRIWTPLGLLGNQKFQAFGKGRYKQQNNNLMCSSPCSTVQGVLDTLSRGRMGVRRALQKGNKLLLLYNCY